MNAVALNSCASIVARARWRIAAQRDGEAQAILRTALEAEPHNVDVLELLAQIAMREGSYLQAQSYLATALELAVPKDRGDALTFQYVIALLKRQCHAQALAKLIPLLQRHPENPSYRATHATLQMELGHCESAMSGYEAIQADGTNWPELELSIGHAAKSLNLSGPKAAAIAYARAIALRQDCGDGWWSLANLKDYHFAQFEIARMLKLESDPWCAPVDRYHLCFALGKALEQQERYRESFEFYARGNRLKALEVFWRSDASEQGAQRLIEFCTPEFFRPHPRVAPKGYPIPVFILGLPRAGSTLIEQILSAHPYVCATKELPLLPRIFQALTRDSRQYPQVLGELRDSELEHLREQYLSGALDYADVQDRSNVIYLTDKMPNNFRHVGLIHLLFPDAKIIDARRGAMACCFSNFKQLYAGGQEFSYSLQAMGRYYRSYVRLMDHWDRALPQKILRVQHEALVTDPTAQIWRILDYLELPRENACLEFWKKERVVATASAHQVRSPINDRGVSQWMKYSVWLQPLVAALDGVQ